MANHYHEHQVQDGILNGFILGPVRFLLFINHPKKVLPLRRNLK